MNNLTLVTGGGFDGLHQNHKAYLANLINQSKPNSILILLFSDSKLAKFKGSERPLFKYSWRQLDIYEFLSKNYPTLNIRFKKFCSEVEVKEILQPYFGNSNYVIGMRDNYNYFFNDPTIITSNLLTVKELPGEHTSNIPFLLHSAEAFSGCSTTHAAAILVRRGSVISVGRSGLFKDEITKICHPASCSKCVPGRCNYYSAEEIALADAAPGDDLFVSYAPNLTSAKLIVKKLIRRVVYFDNNKLGSEGLTYLHLNNIQVKKAGVVTELKGEAIT